MTLFLQSILGVRIWEKIKNFEKKGKKPYDQIWVCQCVCDKVVFPFNVFPPGMNKKTKKWFTSQNHKKIIKVKTLCYIFQRMGI
jgi:hypothetical protein